jgi:hypothetical protein
MRAIMLSFYKRKWSAEGCLWYNTGQTYRFNEPTKEELEIASKAFDDTILTDPPNYTFVHFPCNRRLKPSEIRQRLTLLGVDNVRVIDAHCPDFNVAEFLVHENYVEELKAKFSKAKVQSLDYDFTDPIHLRDSRLSNLSTEEKVEKLKDIRNKYILSIIPRIRYPVNYSVAKSLFRLGHITLDQLKAVLKSYRDGRITDGFTTSNEESSTINKNTDNKDKGKQKEVLVNNNNTASEKISEKEKQSLASSSATSTPSPLLWVI